MFYKGVINAYDSNTRKGTILLTEDQTDVEFLAEDLSNMTISPVIGERVRCIVREEYGKKCAKFIIRRDHKNAHTEKPLNKKIYSGSINVNALKKQKINHDEKNALASARPEKNKFDQNIQNEAQSHFQDSTEQHEHALTDTIVEADEKLQLDLAQSTKAQLNTGSLNDLNFNPITQQSIESPTIANQAVVNQGIERDKQNNLMPSTEPILQNSRTTREHSSTEQAHAVSLTSIEKNVAEKNDIFNFELTAEDIKATSSTVPVSQFDVTEASIQKQQNNRLDDDFGDLGAPIVAVTEADERQSQSTLKEHMTKAFSKDVTNNNTDQQSHPADVRFIQIEDQPINVQQHQKEDELSEQNRELQRQHLAAEALKSEQAENEILKTQTLQNQPLKHSPPEIKTDDVTPFSHDAAESRWQRFKTVFFYKKYTLPQVEKLRHHPGEKKQFNFLAIFSLIAIVGLGYLGVMGYQKFQDHQTEQQRKAQLYLTEHQRAIEAQRRELGKLPDKILSDATLDELLGKDRDQATAKTTQQQRAKMQYACDGRTHCSQMTSYQEAVFFLKNCPNTQMDGNGDGRPCERQFGR